MSARASEQPRLRRPPGFLRRFMASEAAGGIILMAAAASALLIANSPAALPGCFEDLCCGAERPALDQRRTHGSVLPARRA